LGEQTADRKTSDGNDARIDYKRIEQRRTCDRDHRPNEPSASAVGLGRTFVADRAGNVTRLERGREMQVASFDRR